MFVWSVWLGVWHVQTTSCRAPLTCSVNLVCFTVRLLWSWAFGSYMAAAVALDQETNGGVRGFEVCDNIDLEMVLMEYESYHYVKFQKYPKVIRKAVEAGKRTTEFLFTYWDDQLNCWICFISCQGDKRNARCGRVKRWVSLLFLLQRCKDSYFL